MSKSAQQIAVNMSFFYTKAYHFQYQNFNFRAFSTSSKHCNVMLCIIPIIIKLDSKTLKANEIRFHVDLLLLKWSNARVVLLSKFWNNLSILTNLKIVYWNRYNSSMEVFLRFKTVCFCFVFIPDSICFKIRYVNENEFDKAISYLDGRKEWF